MKHFKRAAIGAAGGFVGFEFGDEIKEGLTSAFHSVADYAQNVVHAVREPIPSWGWLQDILPGGTETSVQEPAAAPADPTLTAAAAPAPVDVAADAPPAPEPKPSADAERPAPDKPAAPKPAAQRPVAPAPTPAPSAPVDTEIKKVEVEVSPIGLLEVDDATPRPALMTDQAAAPNATTGSRPIVQFQATGNVGVQVDVYEATPNRSVQITADANGIKIVEESSSHSGESAGDTDVTSQDTNRQTAWAGHDAYRQVFGYDSV